MSCNWRRIHTANTTPGGPAVMKSFILSWPTPPWQAALCHSDTARPTSHCCRLHRKSIPHLPTLQRHITPCPPYAPQLHPILYHILKSVFYASHEYFITPQHPQYLRHTAAWHVSASISLIFLRIPGNCLYQDFSFTYLQHLLVAMFRQCSSTILSTRFVTNMFVLFPHH